MKQAVAWILCLAGLTLQAQKAEVYHLSGFRHDYAIRSLEYIEDLKDTSSLNYVATLRVRDSHDSILKMIAWLDLAQTKAKELGANACYVSAYSEDAMSGTLMLKLYFAGQGFLKRNQHKRDTSRLITFNPQRFPNDTVTFYVGDSRKVFPAKTYHAMPVMPKQGYFIHTQKAAAHPKRLCLKKQSSLNFTSCLRKQKMCVP